MPVTEFPAVPPTQPLGSCHRHWLRGPGPGTHWCSGLCGGGPVPPSTCQGLGSGSVGPSELPGCLPQRPSLSTPGARPGACRVCAPRLRPCRRLPFTPFDSRILVGEAALSPLESERSREVARGVAPSWQLGRCILLEEWASPGLSRQTQRRAPRPPLPGSVLRAGPQGPSSRPPRMGPSIPNCLHVSLLH